MEVEDGFILGIYNYCDRWCDRCAFTSRCRVFADGAEHEAALDPFFKELNEAAPHPQDVREPPSWVAEAIREMNDAVAEALSNAGPSPTEAFNSKLPELHGSVSRRAKAYAFRILDKWRDSQEKSPDEIDPRTVILWFSTLIASKVYRAMSGLAEFEGDREFPPDHEGSAKVALIGIDRSLMAWQDLIVTGHESPAEAEPFITDLHWLRYHIEALIPDARNFVRPAFDEPEAVRRLKAAEL